MIQHVPTIKFWKKHRIGDREENTGGSTGIIRGREPAAGALSRTGG